MAFSPQPEASSTPSLLGSGYAGLVLERLVRHAATVVGAEQTLLQVADPRHRGMMIAVAGHGIDQDLLGRRRSCEGDEADALASGRPAYGSGTAGGCSAAVPLGVGGELRGVLSVSALPGHPLRSELLGDVARLTSRALEHREAGELTDSDPRPEIDRLAETLEQVDAQTNLHCEDVARLARATGERLGLDPPTSSRSTSRPGSTTWGRSGFRSSCCASRRR